MRKWMFILGIILVTTVIGIVFLDGTEEEAQSVLLRSKLFAEVGGEAPSFTLKTLDNSDVYKYDNKLGKPLILNFWASWCGPCKLEAPELVKLYEKYKPDIEIVAINITAEDSLKSAKKFAETYGFQFPVLMDEDAEVTDLYIVQAIPTTYFIDKDGIIVDKVLGSVEPEVLEKKLKSLLH
ncbi:TlpA family protein disulfide reductase [Chengkuizengella axinellae]|uniref:TlpA disulfide reductase family protein n=1 Tax=Chengkuizengella axinellae TaxID=3064388 RepID=A0ABT9J115_9BACL|nr:TlpA disulfide reductase family protein [Chengkuizengella sp. 2205SS18-9]MDP5275288.1 TlpA disulfide reductase family protein [Chengkuizengella sp. 2205SS18-9]